MQGSPELACIPFLPRPGDHWHPTAQLPSGFACVFSQVFLLFKLIWCLDSESEIQEALGATELEPLTLGVHFREQRQELDIESRGICGLNASGFWLAGTGVEQPKYRVWFVLL